MIKLGSQYLDKVSKFEGIAVARHMYLNGCERVTLQPMIDKDGKLPATESFDEPQLILLHDTDLTQDNTTGGCEKYSDNRNKY